MSDKKSELRYRNLNFSSQLVVYSSEVSKESSPIPRTPFIDLPPYISYTNPLLPNSRKYTQKPHYLIRYPLLSSDTHDIFDKYSLSLQDIQFCEQNSIPEAEFCEIIQRWEHATKTGPTIIFDTAYSLAEKLQPYERVIEIYEYWIQRREEIKHPLMRRYWNGEECRDTYLNGIFKFSKLEKRRLRERMDYEVILHTSKRVIRQLEDCYNILKLVLIRETIKKQLLSYNIAEFEVNRSKHSSQVCKAFLDVLSNLKTPSLCNVSDQDLASLHLYSEKHIPIPTPSNPPSLHALLSFSALKKPVINPLSLLKTPQNNLIFNEDTSTKLPIRTTYKLMRIYHKTVILNEESSSS